MKWESKGYENRPTSGYMTVEMDGMVWTALCRTESSACSVVIFLVF